MAAAMESASAHGLTLVSTGASNEKPYRLTRKVWAKIVCSEPDREIENDTHDRRSDAGKGAVQRLVVTQPFDERRAEADPQKARNERAPVASKPPSVPANIGGSGPG